MRICIIGSCGHGGTVFASRSREQEFAGAAPAHAADDMTALLQFAAGQGITIPYFAGCDGLAAARLALAARRAADTGSIVIL